jgi:hypothetical protein|tara:strand:+ start:90 stop:338 length:249 start_codon:yes stop_codon:yes gene_type:complete
MNEQEITNRWTEVAENALLGRQIVRVEYMKQDECDRYYWDKRPITFMLDNGTRVIAMCDDEGNDGGVLTCLTKDKEEVLPVL